MANVEGLTTKHLAKGSQFPKFDNGKLRLYNMRFCPYAQRTLLTLAAKNLPFEVVNVNLAEKPEWYLNDINPLGKVPSLQVKDKVIYESMITSEWADDEFKGTRQVMPKDIYERARQKMLVERLSKLPSVLYPLYRNLNDETCIKNAHEAIQLHEDLLQNNYFSGNECGFVDYMVWPFVERLEAVAVMTQGKVVVSKDRYPKMTAYVQRMMTRPEVKLAYRTPEEHMMFLRSMKDKTPNYDLDL